MKVRRLLGFFSHNQLKVANSFFKKPPHVAWRSFNKMRSPHVLDVISVSENFFKCVKSCGISKKGTRTDHSSVRLEFMNRSIKYKTTFIKKPVFYWKAIKEKDYVNKTFNVNFKNRLQELFNYNYFNESILRSGKETSMINNSENQGWLHFSRNTLTTDIKTQKSVLHDILSDDNTPSVRTLCHLKTLQYKVDKAVSIAKTRWYCHLAEEIHNMAFNPKAAWASIRRLTGGELNHHTTPKLIQMRLPSGSLTDNDDENVSLFANHFKKVFNDHKPTDTTVIHDIYLREVMEELDDPPL